MIIDLRSGEAPSEFEADVCVFGSGPAGVTLALELARKGRDVLLLEGGGPKYEEDSQDLYRGEIIGDRNIDVANSRLRQFGGTSGHWTGFCAPLDPIDFEPRPGRPHFGWPIRRADLDPFYARAQDYLDLGPYRYDWASWRDVLRKPALPLDPTRVITDVFQQSPPTRFAEKYEKPIAESDRIRCVFHANLTDVALAPDGRSIASATVSTLERKTATVKARTFVLACGGIENARLLLNFRKDRPAGLGNENDLVGRFYTDHMTIETSLLMLNDGVDASAYSDYVEVDGATLSIGVKLEPGLVVREGLNNNSAFLVARHENDLYSNDFRNYGWIGFSTMVKAFSRGRWPDRAAEHYCDVVDDFGAVATGVYRHAVRRFLPPEAARAYAIRQDAEQSPDPDSRVALIGETDPLGMNRISLDWRVTSDDLIRLRKSHQIMAAAFGAAGLGRMQVGIGDPPDLSIAYSGYHHMGTTRMHADPTRGVVDADCRLHSVGNLYVAGSSVFTTGGAANPR